MQKLREYLSSGALLTVLALIDLNGSAVKAQISLAVPPPAVRGAIYVPAKAYNAPQMWKDFNVAETRRDFGYAREVHLNSLRIWASYEYWRMEPKAFETSFDQMLSVAHDNGIRILVSLFEMNGVPPAPENMWDTNPETAFCIQSPSADIFSPAHKDRWEAPRVFVAWFMRRFGDDGRLIAIEVFNEPSGDHEHGSQLFAESMFRTAKSMEKRVPLTIGSSGLDNAERFLPLGLDIIQYHDNFPRRIEGFEQRIHIAMDLGKRSGKPVWLTEWQRIRTEGDGFNNRHVRAEERGIDYSSLAPTAGEYPIGNFFWSLMVKPAYLKPQRKNGTRNGLFWPDGSVLSLGDARAIAHDPELQLRERPIPAEFLKTGPSPNEAMVSNNGEARPAR